MIKVFCNKKEKDIVNFWNHTVFHPTNLIEDPMGQLHLNKLARDKAVQIVRIYTMFEESVTLDENGQMQYDFSMSDYRIDELLKRGFTPYLVYGFFPGFLSAEQDDKQDEMLISHRYKNNLLYRSYMTDYNKWGQICYHYTKHLLERYGEDRVSTWYIHCYNEPDLGHFFYKNAPSYRERAAEYCKMYEAFVKGICAVSDKLMIGGVGLSQSATHFPFLEYFLNFVKEKGLRLDFISYHSYGTGPKGMIEGIKPLDIRGAIRNTMMVKRAARLCGFGDLPMVCDEWGACTEGYKGVDTCSAFIFRENEIYAVYFAKMLTLYDEMGLYDPQIICMSGSHNLKVDFGGHRNFFTKHFYPKPIYNAFVLASRLGTEKLCHYADADCNDLSVMPTRHADGHMSILLGYADDALIRQLKPLNTTLNLEGLTKRCRVTGWRIDADHANAIRKFKELGQPENPTEEQMAAIREFGALKPEALGTVDPENPEIAIRLENNATLLLEIEAMGNA